MIVIDIETSGLDKTQHGILSIGAVDMKSPKKIFYQEARLNPEELFDPQACVVNGFTEADARSTSKQSRAQLIRNFSDWLESRPEKVIAGLHVQAFDVPFINYKSEKSRIGLRLKMRSIDLHTLTYAKMLELKKVIPLTDGWSVMDTDFVHPFCGLPEEPRPHNALRGASWEAESMHRLIYGKGLLKEFANHPVPSYLIKK